MVILLRCRRAADVMSVSGTVPGGCACGSSAEAERGIRVPPRRAVDAAARWRGARGARWGRLLALHAVRGPGRRRHGGSGREARTCGDGWGHQPELCTLRDGQRGCPGVYSVAVGRRADVVSDCTDGTPWCGVFWSSTVGEMGEDSSICLGV